jgi:acetyltransferase-like isoleucine patch superfamily enzyme
MKFKNFINRMFFYPLGILKAIHVLGKNGSRDFVNKTRFKNVIIDDGVCVDSNSIIHKHSHILTNCIINNATIDSYTYVGRNCIVQNAHVGKFCSIANDVFIGLGKHPISNFSTAPIFYKKQNILNIELIDKDVEFKEYEKITICHDVWIGARAIILDGVKIGNGAVIAANSVVTKDVMPYAIVGGTPAKLIKYRFSEEKIKKLNNSNWWSYNLDEIKKKINDLNA